MPFFCYVLGNDMMSCSIRLKFKDDKLYELVGFFLSLINLPVLINKEQGN